MKISVIIPVFNSEAFLEECIASLTGQTHEDMEFLFVDDGSRDGSRAILQKAAETDERIRVLGFEKNRGVSAARNAGLEAASGDYVGFCDADDTVEPEMYEKLLSACLRGAEISFCRVTKDRPSGSENVPLGFPDGTVFDREAIRDTLIPAMLALPKDGDGLPLSGYTPRNLFAKSVLNHRFREDIHYAEDLLFIVSCLLDADHAAAVDVAYYHYRFHEGSVTKHYSAHIPDSLEKSNGALRKLLAEFTACSPRMDIRERKTAVDVVRNYCALGTPYSFLERIRLAREYMNREPVKALFGRLSLRTLPRRTAIRLGLMKYRMTWISCILYSTVFRSRM